MASKGFPILFLTLIAFAVFANTAMADVAYAPNSLTPDQCAPECGRRCSNTQYKKACLTYCNKCCAKCLCVPPGTYGNKQGCPCYDNWKTQEGGPKCP